MDEAWPPFFCFGGRGLGLTGNGAFDKRSFCLGDTHQFRHVRRFPGFQEQNPLFLWVESTIRIFADFVKTICFRLGTKTLFPNDLF